MPEISSAAGRVCTGFSKPYVALYSATGGVVSYSNCQVLARGVSVEVSPETSDASDFYADNITAETKPGTFSGGTLTLTVDGLLDTAEKLIMGLPSSSGQWYAYGDSQTIPYVGVGFVARYMSGGNVSYVPIVIAKCAFEQISNSANTQEDAIDYQTQELTATINRADDANHSWKFLGTEYASEAEAVSAIQTKLGGASNACNINSFMIGDAVGTITANTVAITVPSGTAVTSLSPEIVVSEGATISPKGAQDFTNPKTYTVTAANGTATKTYTVTVTVAS